MNIRAVLFDIDGTLFIGMEPIPGAAQAIRSLQEHGIVYRFVSNGTRRGLGSVRDKLGKLGIPVSPNEILTPATAAIAYLKEHGHTSCSLLVTDDLIKDFAQSGIAIRDDGPVVIIGDAADKFTYSAINQAFRNVLNGSLLLALEKDRYWKDGDALSLGAGAFVAGLEFAAGVQAVLMGKPSPSFFAMALQSLGVAPEETLMVGDDIMSDVLGAQNSGIRGILVRTGKYNSEALERSQVIPFQVLDSVADLSAFLNLATSLP